MRSSFRAAHPGTVLFRQSAAQPIASRTRGPRVRSAPGPARVRAEDSGRADRLFNRRECGRRSVASAKATVTGLRALLRFLYLDGQITAPLAGAVPSAACWQLAALELGDISWRRGEITVRGKGNRRDSLPLPADVGEAVAAWLQRCRPPGAA